MATTQPIDTVRQVRVAAFVAVVTIAAAAANEAGAQPSPRVTISVNGAFLATENAFSDRFEFQVNRETGSTQTRYPVEAGLAIDGAVAVRVWRRLGVGAAVSQFTRDAAVTTNSEVPHPFFFERPREIAGDVAGIARKELGVHVRALYELELARRIRLVVFGGPSWIRVDQDVVTSIRYDETFPFDVATFRSAGTRRMRGSAIGFSAGADVSWMFSRHVGIGGVVHATTADVDLPLPGGSKKVSAGGPMGGAGIRVVF